MTGLIKEGFTTLMRQTVGSCQTLRHARVPLAGEACPRAQASPAKGTGGSGDKNDAEMNSTKLCLLHSRCKA